MDAPVPNPPEPVKIAILAIGGQGGGVISGWLVKMAEANGWQVQATSVPGVAQRTGATIYYLEMLPATERKPVLALLPFPGAVDVVIAAEWMEAGRAVQRGLVTPDLTTVIASTHRAYSVREKSVPGQGFADPQVVDVAVTATAKRVLKADFAAAANSAGSVISASLFGALAASGALPFERDSFEATIRAGGKGVKASLEAFASGFDAASGEGASAVEPRAAPMLEGGVGDERLAWQRLQSRVCERFAESVQPMVLTGLVRLIDFQDTDYGAEYLDTLERFAGLDGAGDDLIHELAKYLAGAMAYHDVIRVADLKTRATRFDRVRLESGWAEETPLTVTEYFHPRTEEMTGLLPGHLGARSLRVCQWVIGKLAGGRRPRTTSLTGFGLLYCVAGLRRWRRGMRRHHEEWAHINTWLELVERTLPGNPALVIEIIRCRRLIKGYSDTHARGLSKYDKVLGGIDAVRDRPDAADWARRLREAALKDADGETLDGALKTIGTFAGDAAPA